VPLPKKSRQTDFLERVGITPGKYVLAVARFVPEKGLHDLVEAFQKGLRESTSWSLPEMQTMKQRTAVI